MPEYLSPGVFVEEIPAGPKPIEGVSTSTTGFVGLTERGPTAPRLVTSWGDFVRWFGTPIDTTVSYLPLAVKGYFDNGGKRAFIARVVGAGASAGFRDLATAAGENALRLSALGPGGWGGNILVWVRDGSQADTTATPPRDLFRVTVLYYRDGIPDPFVDPTDPANLANPGRVEPTLVEDFDDLSAVVGRSNYVLSVINGASHLIEAAWIDTADNTPGTPGRPVNTAAGDGTANLQGGDDGAVVTPTDFAGDPSATPDARTGLASLETIDEISILVAPDEVNGSIANNFQITTTVVDQCERLRDRFAVLSIARGQGQVQNILKPRDSSYAGIYYPWIRVFDSRTQDTPLIPPSGHVAGIYARTDVDRGVHKAPANEVVRGIVTRDLPGNRRPLEFPIVKGEHDILNPRGINVIRDFRKDGRGIRVWGARTLSSDPEWRYVNVRRLFLFIEESIDEGTQWVVFEPNAEPTWAKVRRTLTNFLTRVWTSGALFGATREEAFFVKCDRTTMGQDDIDNGRLICLVGVAPVKPAEFVIFRISQKTIEAA